jgi:hypothetical protein
MPALFLTIDYTETRPEDTAGLVREWRYPLAYRCWLWTGLGSRRHSKRDYPDLRRVRIPHVARLDIHCELTRRN